MENIKKRKKVIYASIAILLIIVISITGTYAYYVWTTNEDTETKIMTSVGAATVYYDGGSSLNGVSLKPVADKENGIVKTISIKSDTNSGTISFNLYLDINELGSGLKDPTFKYALYEGNSLKTDGDFSVASLEALDTCPINGVKHIPLIEDKTLSTTALTYTLYLWIDGTVDNLTKMQNQPFNFNLHATGEGAVLKEGKLPDITTTVTNSLAYDIVSKYLSSTKTDVSNNEVTYHYDTANKLMTDTVGNVRYYGDTPSNYIYFNCTDYTTQNATNCETWRIIGVFEGKVKLIRNTTGNTSLGTFSWDYDYNDDNSSTTYDNNWETSSLQNLLNNQYYRNEDTTYFNNSTSGTSVQFGTKNMGIRNNETRSLISDSIYYLGGHSSASVSPDKMYEYERGTKVYSGRPTTWQGKIALAYPSDYGYAADFNECINKTLSQYNYSTCTTYNWMKKIYTSSYNWFITPYSSSARVAFYVLSSGGVDIDGVSNARGVAPVLYLNSDVSVKAGTGESGSPYQLAVTQTS